MSEMKINEVADIVRFAGGTIVGRTKLQKIAYLLSATGLDDNFRFSYKHYGPFSGDLAASAKFGALLGHIEERQDQTAWGAFYSTYNVVGAEGLDQGDPRFRLAHIAKEADSIELELAATAVFLSHDGYPDPWEETAQRKPEKASAPRLQNAKRLLCELAGVPVPRPIPGNVLS